MKIRLDLMLHAQYPQYSRKQIQSWIIQGKVEHNGKILNKPGTPIGPDEVIICNFSQPEYVSRAGYKLKKALEHFSVDVTDYVVMDAGISTGGFTDCLLQQGARKVYGIDVGYGQVDEKIRTDKRVVLMERTNLRYLQDLGELVDLVTLDLSFISVTKVLDVVCAVLKPQGELIVLIKPQFEAAKEQVGRGGIIKNSVIHQEVIERLKDAIKSHEFVCYGVIESPLMGAAGNKEFLTYCKRI